MVTYNPQQFQSTYSTPLGHDLWDFLNEHDNVIRLETASELKRPALEALATRISDKFRLTKKDKREKQLIGHMTRQVLRSRNFELDAHHIKVRNGDLFTYASRYMKMK